MFLILKDTIFLLFPHTYALPSTYSGGPGGPQAGVSVKVGVGVGVGVGVSVGVFIGVNVGDTLPNGVTVGGAGVTVSLGRGRFPAKTMFLG